MFNCPTINMKNRPILKPIKYKEEVEEWNLIPVAKELVDADGVKYNGVVYEPKLVNTYNLVELIQSYSDDVGIQNILKKLSLSGDKSILNQTGREPLCPNGGLEPVQDFSQVPESKAEAFNIVAAGVQAYDNLPADIKGKMSLEQFVKEFGQSQFDQFVQGLVAKYQTPENKEGE